MLKVFSILCFVSIAFGQAPTVCPPTNQIPPLLLPHDTDCSLFNMCFYGNKLELECSNGMVFDFNQQTCVVGTACIPVEISTTTGVTETTQVATLPTTVVTDPTTVASDSTTAASDSTAGETSEGTTEPTTAETTEATTEPTTTVAPVDTTTGATTTPGVPTAPSKCKFFVNYFRFNNFGFFFPVVVIPDASTQAPLPPPEVAL